MKKILVLLLSVFISISVFAQGIESAGVTDTDCKNFAKNYQKIYEYIATLDDTQASSLMISQKTEALLEKCGISGPNRFAKFISISTCLCIVYVENSLDEETAAIYKAYGIDPTEILKNNINEKDYEIVKRNYNILIPAIEYAQAFSEDNEISEDSYNDDDYGYDSYSTFDDFYSSLNNQNNNSSANEALKKEYENNLKFAQTFADNLTSSKKDVGMLCKQYDKNRASKYKLVLTIDENLKSKFSNGHYFKIDYKNNYYNGYFMLYAEYSCDIAYGFRIDGSMDEDFETGEKELDVTKVEVYSPGYADEEGEVVIYLKEAGPVHIWYNQYKAILQSGGIGPVEGYHFVPLP